MSAVEMATTFRRAADVIRIGGLARGRYEDGTAHCTVGALIVARGIEHWAAWVVQSEIGHLVDLLGEFNALDDRNTEFSLRGLYTVASWNDTEGRTADEVVTLLEQAAEKLEADQ